MGTLDIFVLEFECEHELDTSYGGGATLNNYFSRLNCGCFILGDFLTPLSTEALLFAMLLLGTGSGNNAGGNCPGLDL